MSQPESTTDPIRPPTVQHDQQSEHAARDDAPDEPCSAPEMQHAHQGAAAGSEGGQGNDWSSRGGVPPGIASFFMSMMAGIRGAFGQEGPNVRRPEEARGNDAAPPAADARPQGGSDGQNAEEGTQGSAPADPQGSAPQGGQQRRGVAIRLFGVMPPVPPPGANAPPMPGGSPGDAAAQANAPGEQDATARPAEGASATGGPDGGAEHNGEAPQNSGGQERRLPQFLLYVSREVSPLPFGFLYDAATGMAWPVINQPTDNPSEDGTQTINVIGTPFHVQFNVQPAPPPEEPDPERAAAFVRGLERADAELRSRMARLGMGDLGGAAPHVGCGICLEPYAEEDVPAWFVGEQQEQDMAVVAVPCGGFHTLHAACLQSWLASLPPSKWTCPFCRSPLKAPPKHTHENERASHTQEEAPAKPTRTLREEIHLRERQQGWRCDAPACLPRYEVPKADGNTHGLDSFSSELVRLYPCRHEVHVDCLCTSMRVEAAEAADRLELEYDEASDAESEDVENQAQSYSNVPVDAQANEGHGQSATVGKWVTCAACRKDAWAQLPARRRPQRNTAPRTR